MGRASRRLSFRISVAVAAAGASAWLWRQWQYRPSSASALPQCDRHPHTSRAAHWASLRASQAEPFDVLVVGGGLTGLYAAVDAAQRGMRVALVEAGDFGSGHTSHTPTILPGAFPCVQRAIRQRDTGWLRAAGRALEAAAVWRNVAPHCAKPEEVRTLITTFYAGEMAELACTAVLSTLVSCISGGSPRWCGVVWPSVTAVSVLGSERARVYGGVEARDAALDHSAAVISLALTAEALGVTLLNYASLVSLSYNRAKDEGSDLTTGLVHARVKDMDSDGDPLADAGVKVFTKGVINCAGARAVGVRDLAEEALSGAEKEEARPVFSSFYRCSYVVVPRSAVYASNNGPGTLPLLDAIRSGGRLGNWFHGHTIKGDMMAQVSSKQHSLSATFIMPWYDDTVLVGPCYDYSSTAPPSRQLCDEARTHDAASVEALVGQLTRRLYACGVEWNAERTLSVLSTVVPVVDAINAPWAADVLNSFYHVSTHRNHTAAGGGSKEDACPPSSSSSSSSSSPPLVHVYGGLPLRARDVAQEAVDALLHATTAGSTVTRLLAPCRTRTLKLIPPPAASSTMSNADDEDALTDPAAAVRGFVREQYARRVEDVLLRRLHAGYTSPASAVRTAPLVAQLMADELQWDAARTQREIAAAHKAIEQIAA